MDNPDLNIQLLEQLPPWYREILDYQEICQTEQAQFDNLAAEINAVADNFFFQTMDESAISMWESILQIIPNPSEESLDFRRFRVLNRVSTRPPYTIAFLYQKLDEIIGTDQWRVTVDYPNYTLYIETSAKNKLWSGELSITIGKIKPAHIAYIPTPLVEAGMNLSEVISKASTRWNYRLGNWALGSAPFCTIYDEEVIKLAETPSIQQLLLSKTANFVAGAVAGARLNGSVVIDNINKSVDGNVLTVTYRVLTSQVSEITSVELLDADGNPLTQISAYVAIGNDGTLMKHVIRVDDDNFDIASIIDSWGERY